MRSLITTPYLSSSSRRFQVLIRAAASGNYEQWIPRRKRGKRNETKYADHRVLPLIPENYLALAVVDTGQKELAITIICVRVLFPVCKVTKVRCLVVFFLTKARVDTGGSRYPFTIP